MGGSTVYIIKNKGSIYTLFNNKIMNFPSCSIIIIDFVVALFSYNNSVNFLKNLLKSSSKGMIYGPN